MDALSTTDHALLLAMSEVRGLCKKTELAQVLEEIATSPTAEREKKHEGPVGAVLDQLFEQADRVRIAFWERELERLSHVGIRLATVCDADYPVNLRMVFNRPAYLFYTGELRVQDQCAVAVVGTRKPSSVGLRMATAVAEGLADEGVTVVSGLALGVDIAAHAGALNRRGRTLAVLGSGIEHVAPVKHRPIATQIAALQRGAVVSQFPP